MSGARNAAIFLAWTASSAAWFFGAGVTLFVVPPLGLAAFGAPFVVATARDHVIGFAAAMTGLGTTFLIVGEQAPKLHGLVLVGAIGIIDGLVLFALEQLRQHRVRSAR
jgi:hypothetical protein